MSQHQVKIVFKRAVEGIRTSSCGRFEVTYLEARPPAARWALTDKTVDHEVFSGAKLDDCREAALAIINATQTELHPAAILAGLDESWQVGEAKTTGARHGAGDLVAWKQAHGVVNLEPQPVKDARRREAEQRALEAYRAEVEGIDLELEQTDEEPGEVAPHVVISVTKRAAVRVATVFERTGEGKGWRYTVPARIPPVPRAWVDLIAVDASGNDVERRVYIRDTDTERDIARRCNHVFRTEGGGGHGDQHKHQGQSETQGDAADPFNGPGERAHQGRDRRPGRPDPDGRRRHEASDAVPDSEPQRQAHGGAAVEAHAHRGGQRAQAPPGPPQDHRAPRGRVTAAELMMLSDYDSSRGATW